MEDKLFISIAIQRMTNYTEENNLFDTRVQKVGESTHGIWVKVIDCEIAVSEFEFKLRYYVHFQSKTLCK